jgi:hypothetical protein
VRKPNWSKVEFPPSSTREHTRNFRIRVGIGGESKGRNPKRCRSHHGWVSRSWSREYSLTAGREDRGRRPVIGARARACLSAFAVTSGAMHTRIPPSFIFSGCRAETKTFAAREIFFAHALIHTSALSSGTSNRHMPPMLELGRC